MDLNVTPSSSLSTVPHECNLAAMGYADRQAQRNAKLQKQGRPWMCSKLKREVTNPECVQLHELGISRICRDCGIPNILPKQESQKMAKISALKKPEDLSWDDFDPITPTAPQGIICVTTQAKADRLSLSSGLVKKLGWETGMSLDIRTSSDRKSVAIKPSEREYIRGISYKLTACSSGTTKQINCDRLLKELRVPGSTAFEVTVTGWGVVVHLDRTIGN